MKLGNIFMRTGLFILAIAFSMHAAEAKANTNRLGLKLASTNFINEQRINPQSQLAEVETKGSCSHWDPRCPAKTNIE